MAVGVGSQPIYHEGEPVRDLSQIMRTSMRGGTTLTSASAVRREEAQPRMLSSPSKSPAPAVISAARSPVGSGMSGAGGGDDSRRYTPGSPATTRRVLVPTQSPPPQEGGGGYEEGGEISDLHAVFLAFCAFGATASVPSEVRGAVSQSYSTTVS